MNSDMENLIPLNIALLIVVILTFVMMTFWSRATRGEWPSRKKLGMFLLVCLGVWLCGNASYLYFHLRASVQ